MDEKTIEAIMVEVCTLCHWPYVETDQERLDKRCAVCPAERILKASLGGGCYGVILHKLCTRLGHPWRKRIASHGGLNWYICRVCGEVGRCDGDGKK